SSAVMSLVVLATGRSASAARRYRTSPVWGDTRKASGAAIAGGEAPAGGVDAASAASSAPSAASARGVTLRLLPVGAPDAGAGPPARRNRSASLRSPQLESLARHQHLR